MNDSISNRWNFLVIGYGNELRGDDGAGLWVAARVEELRWPGIRVLTPRQLMPEQAEDLAQTDHVIFIDARPGDGRGVEVCPVAPEPMRPGALGHVASPAQLLGLCGLLYGRTPEAWLVSIPVEDMDSHIGLADRTLRRAEEAFLTVRQRIAP